MLIVISFRQNNISEQILVILYGRENKVFIKNNHTLARQRDIHLQYFILYYFISAVVKLPSLLSFFFLSFFLLFRDLYPEGEESRHFDSFQDTPIHRSKIAGEEIARRKVRNISLDFTIVRDDPN